MASKYKATVTLSVKEPDEFFDLVETLGWSDRERGRFLEFGEYANLELKVAKDGTFKGRFIPYKK